MQVINQIVLFVFLICNTNNTVIVAQTYNGEKIAIGAVFDQNTEEIQNVFKYAVTQHNQNISSRGKFELQAFVDVINTADAFKLSRLVCNQFARGVWSMIGAVTPDSFDTLHSYTNTFQMPFVTPWFPEKVIPPSSGLIDHAVNMRPDYHKAIIDTILHYQWKEIVYIYDSFDGLLRLQQLYQFLQPGRSAFKISLVKWINNSSETIDFLLELEKLNRWNYKRIVLDCSAKTAKSILLAHVRNINLGRRTYHYLLSGLIMDDHWDQDVPEYGAVNITGFCIIDHSRRVVRDFVEGFRKMDPKAKETISAQAALMYDGVQALIDALGRFWRKKPEAFKSAMRRNINQGNTSKVIDCNTGKGWVVEHGDKISRLIKKSDIEGLTGNILFDDEGHRYNFSIQIVEMNSQNVMAKIATWSDKNGLLLIHSKQTLQSSNTFHFDVNKTFVITTILHDPYMMQKAMNFGPITNDHYYGFCKDLIVHISRELGIKYEIKVVKDGDYGSETSNRGWNGMVGELIRKEADIAIGPLAITIERQNVVDFSEPFLSFNYAIKTKRSFKNIDTFGFLKPLSKEIWLCVVFSFFAVSIVLFLVSRFSPNEWRSSSIRESLADYSTETNDVILHNDFSIWNSFWFSLGSFMQQGSEIVPKSLSGRIVGTVWWFFALILVCSYTANLAAYLIVERLNEPMKFNSQLETENALACQNLGEDPVLTVDDLKNFQFAIDDDGHNICNNALQCQPKQVEFAVAIPKDSEIREKLNMVIIHMKKTDVLLKLLRKWIIQRDQQDCILKKKEDSVTEMSLSQVAGIFYILIGGLVVALSVALLEFYHNGKSSSAKANIILKTTKRTKVKLTKNDTKTNRTQGDRLSWNGAPYHGFFNTANQIGQDDNLQASFTHV